MEALLQSLFAHYTSMFFLVSAAWMLIFGMFMNVVSVLFLTRLSARSIVLMTYRFHIFNVIVAALCGRLLSFLVTFLVSFINSNLAICLDCNQSIFVGMMACLYLLSTYFFCVSFATVKCGTLERWLLVTHLVTGVIGYFMMQAWGLF